jgi:hypothetical protein
MRKDTRSLCRRPSVRVVVMKGKTPSKQQSSNREGSVARAGGAIVVATNTSKAKSLPERALAGWTVIFSQIHFAGRVYRAHFPAHLE